MNNQGNYFLGDHEHMSSWIQWDNSARDSEVYLIGVKAGKRHAYVSHMSKYFNLQCFVKWY